MRDVPIIAVVAYKNAMLKLLVADVKQKMVSHMSPQERGQLQYALRECLKANLEQLEQRRSEKR